MINKISDEVYQITFKSFGSCVYLIKLEKNILIDSSSKENAKELLEELNKLNIDPRDIGVILLTHSHFDHIGNIEFFPNAIVHKKNNLNEFNDSRITIIESPGHTKDSVCFLFKDILFSGDTLFHNGIGRTDFPESAPDKMKDSLEKLKKINYKTLCPGHVD
jgi:glyoxylase-like metal-dependent hydrolase (beta-lactamase superfamily II)